MKARSDQDLSNRQRGQFVRVKQVAHLNPNRSEATSLLRSSPVTFLPMEAIGTDGRARYDQPVEAAQVWQGFTYFRRGDILLAKITPCFENGKTALLDSMPTDVGFGSTEFHVLRPRSEIDPAFLHLVVRTAEFRHAGEDHMVGAAGQQRVPTDFVANYQFPLPPLDEQRAIGRFLDRKSRRIARFIRSRQRMIALLNEQKQAIIHQAVTRGLDPDVPLKPSSIDWLGDIPAHWEVRRLKSAFSEFDVRSVDGHETLLSLRMLRGLVPHNEVSDKRIESSALTNYKIVKSGHLVMNRMRAATGLFAIAHQEGLVSPDYATFQIADRVSPGYFLRMFKLPSLMHEFRQRSSGLGTGSSGFLRLYSDDFGNIAAPFPPTSEQEAISQSVNSLTWEAEQRVAKLYREIDLIREYRTRLIADVVSGKLDIRDHPDAAEDAPDDLDDTDALDGILAGDVPIGDGADDEPVDEAAG